MTVFVVTDGEQKGTVKEVCRISDVQQITEHVSDDGKSKYLQFDVKNGKKFSHSLLDFSFVIGQERYNDQGQLEEVKIG